MPDTNIAVYGTLRKPYGNHGFIRNCEFVGKGRTVEMYQLSASGIPFVHPDKPLSHIVVEVYKVPEDRLPAVDALEGHPDWYERRPIQVILDDKTEVTAELYFNTQEGSVIIESGDYEDYRPTRRLASV